MFSGVISTSSSSDMNSSVSSRLIILGGVSLNASSLPEALVLVICFFLHTFTTRSSALGEYPVLLLDDVLSELDSSRQDFILNNISDGQVLITCCEDTDISQKTGGNVIEVVNGEIRRV